MANMARMSPTYATDLALGGATLIAMVQNAVVRASSEEGEGRGGGVGGGWAGAHGRLPLNLPG